MPKVLTRQILPFRRMRAAGHRSIFSVVGMRRARSKSSANAPAGIGRRRWLPGEGHLPMHPPMHDSAALQSATAEVERHFGRAGALVNSAGTTKAVPHANLDAMDDENFDRILITNVRGPFATVRAFAPARRRCGDCQRVVAVRHHRAGQQHRLLRLVGGAGHDRTVPGARAGSADSGPGRVACRGGNGLRARAGAHGGRETGRVDAAEDGERGGGRLDANSVRCHPPAPEHGHDDRRGRRPAPLISGSGGSRLAGSTASPRLPGAIDQVRPHRTRPGPARNAFGATCRRRRSRAERMASRPQSATPSAGTWFRT